MPVQLLLLSGKASHALPAVIELALFCRVFLIQLPEQGGQPFELCCSHPALLDEHVLLVEDARTLGFLLLDLLD